MGSKKKVLRDVLYFLSKWTYPFVSDALFNNALFFYNCMRLGKPFYWQNLKNPRTFNEKVSWIKFHQRNPLAPVVADKLKCKDYVASLIGEEYVIPTLRVFPDARAISLEDLPDQFILKLNTGSGSNLICTDKAHFDLESAIAFFEKAKRINPFYLSREWHYRQIAPVVFAEPLLGENIADYKLFCFKGKPFCIQVDTDRFVGHKRDFFDLEWNLLEFEINYPKSGKSIARPDCLSEMIDMAKVLSREFFFARIDLYECNGRVFVGEITLHPGGGVEPFATYEQDLKMGEHVEVG